jgi:hypothetical protein
MRAFLAFISIFLFAWNSVLGGMDALVLCLHSEGHAHVELLAKETSESEGRCVDSETWLNESHCPPCTDYVLESTDLGPTRAQEFVPVNIPMPFVVAEVDPFSVATLYGGLHLATFYPTRGPPGVESTSELICRTTVLRL